MHPPIVVLILCAVVSVLVLAVHAPRQPHELGDLAQRVLVGLLAVGVLLTAGCGRKDVKPDLPAGVVIKPQAVNVTRTVYVSVPADLTDPLPIAEGPLSQCPDVAAARREALKRANARFAKVRALSGGEVKP